VVTVRVVEEVMVIYESLAPQVVVKALPVVVIIFLPADLKVMLSPDEIVNTTVVVPTVIESTLEPAVILNITPLPTPER